MLNPQHFRKVHCLAVNSITFEFLPKELLLRAGAMINPALWLKNVSILIQIQAF